MRPSTRVSHAALFLLLVGGVIWLGAVNIRALISNDMLKTGTLEFEEYLAPEAEREIFRLISFTSVVIMISYTIVLVSGAVFLATSPLRLKEHGWLMMSAILFSLFVPVELYTMYLDAAWCTWSFSRRQGMMSFVSFSTPVSEFSQAHLLSPCSAITRSSPWPSSVHSPKLPAAESETRRS